MLTMTKSAAEAIREIVTASGVPDDGGVRIELEPVNKDTARLAMSVTDAAEPGDARLEQEGANVFVEESTALMLSEKLLDATVREDGVEFSVIDSGPAASANGQGVR
jgi:iron-sulfur cluster assembly protein